LLLILTLGLSKSLVWGNVDSLKTIVETTQSDTVKLQAMKLIYMNFIYSDPEKCIRHARESVVLSHQLDAYEFETHALLAISQIYQSLHYQQLGIQYCMEAKRICEGRDYEEGLSNVYNSLGAIKYSQEQPDSALYYFQKSLKIRRSLSFELDVAGSLNNIGLIKIDLESYSDAQQYLLESFGMYASLGHARGAVSTLSNLGEVAREIEDFDLSRQYLSDGIDRAMAGDIHDLVPILEFQLARTELDDGNVDLGRQEFKRLEGEGELPVAYVQELHEMMADLAKKDGDFETAFDRMEILRALDDSLQLAQTEEQLSSARMLNRITLEEQEMEFNDRQEAIAESEENKRSRLIFWLFIMGISFSLLLAAILFIRGREQRKLSQKLTHEIEEQTVELRRAISELNTFIYRSSHDLRGPINTIQGLQVLLESDSIPKEKVSEMLGRKIGQLEKGQRHLVQSMEFRNRVPELEIVNVHELVHDVVQRLKTHYQDQMIDVQIDFPGTSLFMTDAWVMSQVVEYLLDNAIVFSDSSVDSWCSIKMRRDEKNMYMMVEDNGIGMPEEVRNKAKEMFFRGSNASRGNGLGLYNADLGIEMLRGTLEIKPRSEGGTMISLVVPVLDSLS